MVIIRLCRTVLSVFFLLFSLILVRLFAQYLGQVDVQSPVPFYFGIGFLSYIPLHAIFKKFIVMHVFSHEITHALWSALFGGKVDELYVSRRKGGFTRYTRGNFLVTLAPYFFPLYSLVFLSLFFIVQTRFHAVFALLCGFSACFHLIFAVYSIGIGQPDLKKEGTIFSFSFIIMMNILTMSLIFLTLADASLVNDFLLDGGKNFYRLIQNSISAAQMFFIHAFNGIRG